MEIVLAEGATSGHASSSQFGRAAFTTFQQCVVNWGYGGIVSNIGKPDESIPGYL